MGCKIQDLLESETISLEDLKDKKLAIDSYNMLYQFLTTIRQKDGTPLMDSQGRITSHLQGLFARTTKFMKGGLKLVFVFDGKPPELKKEELEKRKKLKIEAQKLFKEAVEREDVDAMQKYGGRFSYLSEEMIEESKRLISALGCPIINAPSEAEAQASYLVKNGDCYAVVSQDADAFLFGSERTIKNLSIEGKRKKAGTLGTIKVEPEITFLEKNLKTLDINQEQLIVLGILVGTDFNTGGVKGIGSKKGLKLVKDYKDKYDELFKDLFKTYEWTFPYDWKIVFDVIKNMPIEKKYKLEWKEVNEDEIIKLLCDEHGFSKERIEKSLDDLSQKPKNQKGLGEWF